MPEPHIFGEFEFDRSTLRLTRAGADVALSGLPLRMLELLLDSGGRLVPRAEFKQTLWPHAIRIDTERRLNTAMRALRGALGDEGRMPRFIETVRGRGYRWIGAEPAKVKTWLSWPSLAVLFILFLLPLGSAPAPAPVAELLEVRLALEQWRRAPSPLRRRAFETALVGARGRLGDATALDTLAAEYALAGQWDWAAAEALYRRALTREPANPSARVGLAWLLIHSGRRSEAVGEIARLIPLAPLGGDGRAEIGWMLLRLDRPDRALSLCSGNEPHLNLLSCRHTALARLGRTGEAVEAGISLMRSVGASESRIAWVRAGHGREAYRRFLDWRAGDFLPTGASGFQRAQLLADAGRLDEAMAALERAYAARDPLMVKLASTREFAPLARLPRFRALLQSVGGTS